MARIIVLLLLSLAILSVDGNAIANRTGTGLVMTYIFEPLVSIIDSDKMTDVMKTEAVQVLKRFIDEDSDNPCKGLRDYFMAKYSGYIWNCVEYKSYAIHRDVSIDLRVDDFKYTLFGISLASLKT
ncbi:uncharacterized protein LOC116178156 [Photinus pyralis]|uniref:uncharacterized protein LOC116178156 n=1 Tax=Photinus pyralis TaxID=7054 RepID=UPI0012675495|nr:uncharacterized protein LOC116178156 [Photinus pyralis]